MTTQATTETKGYDQGHTELIASLLQDPNLRNLYFDISWDEVAKYAVSSPQIEAKVAALFNRYPDRFLFGTDNVAPSDQKADLRPFYLWTPVFARLTPQTSLAIRRKNYERLFDAARTRVRAWEKIHLK